MHHRFIVFDLDGTLVESLPGIAEGVARAMAALGLPAPEPERVRGMIGFGAKHLCAQALGYENTSAAPPELLEAMYDNFCREYPHCWQGDYTLPYPGAPELLERLQSAGARLAVLSNKPHAVTHPMVRALFPRVGFDPILGYTGSFPRKPAPDALLHIAEQWQQPVSALTLVGDSCYDAQTARNAGAHLLLVDWGYAQHADLQATGAPIAHSMAELAARLLGT